MPKLKMMYDPQGGEDQELHYNQGRIFNSMARFKVCCCGRGFGKTAMVLAEIAKESQIPNSVIWYIGITIDLGMKQIWDRVIQMFPKEYIVSANKSEKTITLVNGTKIMIKGANTLRTATNLRGNRINLAILDEAAFMNEDVWYKIIQSAVRRTSGRVIFLSTPNGKNWFKALCETKHADWEIFHFTSYDNPHFPQEEIDAQRDESKTLEDDLSFRQEVLAEFLDGMGTVYCFSESRHLCTQPAEYVKWGLGIDTGVSDYTASIWVGITKSNQFIVDWEYKNNKVSLPRHIEYIKNKSSELGCYDGGFKNAIIVIDQSTNKTELTSGSSVFKEFRKAGVPVLASERNIQLGVECVKKLLEDGKLLVKPYCKSVITAMKEWEHGKHEPDVLAALRYILRFLEKNEPSLFELNSEKTIDYSSKFSTIVGSNVNERPKRLEFMFREHNER